jgi:GntR family transcriptional repressor for pyruvate dehydrogenase complex
MAALRATTDQLKAIEAAQKKLLDAQDGPEALEADLAWHRTVAQASGNQILQLILDSLGDLGRESRLRTIGRIGKSPAIEQHGQVIEALLRRNPDAAAEAMKNHILAAGRDMQLEATEKTRRKKLTPDPEVLKKRG